MRTLRDADAIHGGMSKPEKMPGLSYGLPAKRCKVGQQLAKIPGSVCSSCYALKGRYVFPNVLAAQERRFASLQHPQWVDAVVFTITRKKCTWFRWHDSGDLQGMWHLENIVEVAKRLPDVRFWLPTRENALILQWLRERGALPTNLVARVSGAMIDGAAPIKFFNTSTVTSKGDASCPAPQQGGKCGDCRKCWDPNVRNVSYGKH